MRWIVTSLVVMNILTFAYFQLFVDSSPSGEQAASVAGTLPESVQPIILFSEKPGRGSISAVRVAPELEGVGAESSQIVESVVPDQPLCTLVGSFKRLLKAEYFSERLVALGLHAEVRHVVVASEPGYWLHLPPEVSRKEALRRLRELQSRKIDSYIIPSGNLENGISLGMFSNKEHADTMLARIQKQGYQPQIASVPREQKEIWVFLPEGEAAKLRYERWAELLSSENYLQKRQNLCTDVASSQKFL